MSQEACSLATGSLPVLSSVVQMHERAAVLKLHDLAHAVQVCIGTGLDCSCSLLDFRALLSLDLLNRAQHVWL